MEKLCSLEKQAPMYVVIQQFIVSISYNEFVIIKDSGNLNFNKVIFNKVTDLACSVLCTTKNIGNMNYLTI